MITLEDYWMGRDKKYPPSEIQVQDAEDLIEKINLLSLEYDHELTLTSGYRPPEITDQIPHAVHDDAHERCQGIDLRDEDKELSQWLLCNQAILETLGLWMESPQSAHDHVHLQNYPPKSGKRIFLA